MRKLVATFCLVFILPLQGAFFSLVRAQGGITSDGSLGTQVTQNGNVHTITGGTRPGGGSNLFHSFGEFGVPTDNIANFLNDAVLPTTNILSRVTGGNPSNILGTIQTEGFGNANLFLMNPAGIVFGPNASLNVGGATHFTTADYLQLADGVQFTALPSLQDALLSVAPIEAFGFLESNPASLSVDGSMLTVKDGETLSLVGGDIDISGGSLKSADGQINLVSLNSPGTVNFGENGGLQVQATQLGNIGLSDNAAINVNGESGGSIIIRGGQLMLDGSRISANATGSPSTAMGDSTPAGMAGASEYGIDIGVTQDVVLDNGSFVVANVGGSMNGRDIKVMAGGDLEIRHSTVQTQTTTNGTAGNIEIHANNLVFNIDKPNQSLNDLFGISSFTTGSGDAGNLQLQTNSFDMVGGFLATFTGGSGNAGNIELTVTKDISIFGGRGGGNIVTNAVPLGPGPPPSGNAGNLSIHATNLTMAGDSQIQAVTAVGPGKGGNIQVILTGGLELQEASQVGTFSAGGSVGDAGDILISADNVSLIGVENPTPDGNFFGNQTLITASTTGAGKGGTINIEAGNVVITNKAAINTSTSGTGDGGNINVSAKNFNLTNGGHVRAVSTSTSQDSGDAGNFVINAAETILLDKATMTAESAQSSGGNIKLTANDMIQLVDSTIASSVQGDATTVGGDVNLDPDFIILQNSQILAKAVAGKGGNIDLVASKAVLLDAQSNLDASSQTGISGSVTIESPIQVLSGTIAPLPDQPVNVATLYAARCVAGEGGHFSTFVDSKSDSVAPTPGTFLASPFIPVTDASQHGMGNKPALATEVSLSGHEAAMHLAAYTPPVLFAQATGPPVPCP